ncbi:MAG: hypothetical protein HND51_07450 [Chloroflexi bacterium]|nr:hypothetical protein [Chloroflexota bacterium]
MFICKFNHPSIKGILICLGLLLILILSGCSSIGASGVQEGGTITGRVWLDENADAECDDCECEFYLEDIPIRLYEAPCGGLIVKTVMTDAEGIFSFPDLEPGSYCVMPNVKLICEGYQATTPITQTAELNAGETIELDWFGFDHHFDVNE